MDSNLTLESLEKAHEEIRAITKITIHRPKVYPPEIEEQFQAFVKQLKNVVVCPTPFTPPCCMLFGSGQDGIGFFDFKEGKGWFYDGRKDPQYRTDWVEKPPADARGPYYRGGGGQPQR